MPTLLKKINKLIEEFNKNFTTLRMKLMNCFKMIKNLLLLTLAASHVQI